MSEFISNEKKLKNPVDEETQQELLNDGNYLKYYLELTDCNINVSLEATSWDGLMQRLSLIKKFEDEYFGGSKICEFTLKCRVRDQRYINC